MGRGWKFAVYGKTDSDFIMWEGIARYNGEIIQDKNKLRLEWLHQLGLLVCVRANEVRRCRCGRMFAGAEALTKHRRCDHGGS